MAHQLVLVNFLLLQAKGIAVDGAPKLVNRWLAPAACSKAGRAGRQQA